jgi:hypothetical protein
MLLKRLQALETKPRKPRKPKSATIEYDTASKRSQTIALQAILMDSPTWLPMRMVAVKGWEKWSQSKLQRHMEGVLDRAGAQVASLLNLWKNVDEQKKNRNAASDVATESPAKRLKPEKKVDKGKGRATEQDSDEDPEVQTDTASTSHEKEKEATLSDDEEEEEKTSAATDQPGGKRKAAVSREKDNKRTQIELYAQETVPRYHGNRCALTYKLIVDAAHIFPVGVRKKN